MSQDAALKRAYDQANKGRRNERVRVQYEDPQYRDRQNARKRARLKRNKTAYFIDKTCIRCGSIDRLELDHIDPSTKISHHIWGWAASRREAEIAKCQVLCRPCHINKTVENKDNVHYGEDHGMSALTWAQVREIRAIVGMTHQQIADRYPVTRSTIGKVLRNEIWMVAS